VVVTGTAGATPRRTLGNAVSTIDAAQVVRDAPVPNVQGLLNGRAPGVVVQTATGNVGTGARIRVRGASSFSLSNEPLVYIDGVRANASPATGPENQDFGSSSISRINDINPDEIESIEVIKGPAAATLYGTEASNGVIQIITKRGRNTPAQWNAVVRQGVNYLQNPAHYFPVNWGLVGPDEDQLQSIDIVALEESRGNDIFRTGHQSQYNLSVGGGSELFHYYASGAFENGQGVEPSNDVRHTDGRVNLQLTPSSKLTLSTNLGYVAGPTNLGCEAGCGGRVWTTLNATPTTLDSDVRGFGGSGAPSEYDQLYHFSQQLNRFTGSVTAEHRPTTWLTQRLVAGTDRTRETNVTFAPRIDALFDHFGTDALGYKSQNDRSIDVTTVDYSATGTFNLLSALRSSTSVCG